MGKTKFDFSGQVAIATGAAVGIGRGAAQAFADFGAKVYLLDIDDEKTEKSAETIRDSGGDATFIHCDITNSGEVKAVFERIVSEAGRIDVLLNNAGGFNKQLTVAETDEEEWDQVISRNLKGVFLCSRAAIPTLMEQKSGRIINMGSVAGQASMTRSSPPYSAAKLVGHDAGHGERAWRTQHHRECHCTRHHRDGPRRRPEERGAAQTNRLPLAPGPHW